jgi:hypothetical protein
MPTRLLAAAAVLILHSAGIAPAHASSQQPRATPPAGEGRDASAKSGAVSTGLVGVWKSAASKSPLSTAFDESVWGRNASAVRTVELDIRQGGQAVLKVTTNVTDARGRLVRGSAAVEEARLVVGKAGDASAAGIEYAVMVVSAERRYPDDPASKWALDGLKVRLVERDDRAGLEIRYDTPEGRGSFWETLRRQVSPAKKGATPS